MQSRPTLKKLGKTKVPSETDLGTESVSEAPFEITYEIFINPGYKKLAYMDREIRAVENRSLSSFMLPPRFTGDTTLTEEELNIKRQKRKTSLIKSIRDSTPTPDKLSTERAMNVQQYSKMKEYFEKRIHELGLKNPLIFYDENALRIDIGYGFKEFHVIFPDFFYKGNPFQKIFHPNKSIFLLHKIPEDFKLNFVAENYSTTLKNETKRIFTTAEREFNKPLPSKVSVVLPSGINETGLIETCLKNNQGFVVGEVHNDKSAKQFFIDNMGFLKSQGVEILYMEHLLHECHQTLLDEYYRSPPNTKMPQLLELYLKDQDKNRGLSGSATFYNVVKAAKENGIRIIAIDSEVTYQLGVAKNIGDLSDSKEDRIKAMNMLMLERFQEYQNSTTGKYVMFIGSAHVATYLNIPGGSELLGCPSIVINDLNKTNINESIKQNVEFHVPHGMKKEILHFDILYHRSPMSKTYTTPGSDLVSNIMTTLDELDEAKCDNGLKALCKLSKKNSKENWNKIIEECQSRTSSWSINSLYRFFSSSNNARDQQIDLLYRAIANFNGNIIFNRNIKSLEQLIIVQQKREVIEKCIEEINRLMPSSMENSFSVVTQLGDYSDLKVDAYRTLIAVIKNSDPDKKIEDILKKENLSTIPVIVGGERVSGKKTKFYQNSKKLDGVRINIEEALSSRRLFKSYESTSEKTLNEIRNSKVVNANPIDILNKLPKKNNETGLRNKRKNLA